MYERKICGVLCANTHIHHHHSEWGKVLFKELCLRRVYYSGSQAHCGRQNHIKRVCACVCGEAGGGYTIYRRESSACQVRFTSSCSPKSYFLIQLTPFWTFAYLILLPLKKRSGREAECVRARTRSRSRERLGVRVWQRVWEAEPQPERRVILQMKLSIPTPPTTTTTLSNELHMIVIHPPLSQPAWDHPSRKYGGSSNQT